MENIFMCWRIKLIMFQIYRDNVLLYLQMLIISINIKGTNFKLCLSREIIFYLK